MEHWKIVSFNVRGLNNSAKRLAILSMLDATDCDIGLVQETHLSHRDIHRLRSWYFLMQMFSSSTRKKEGVAILLSKRFRGTLGSKVA